MEFIRKSWHQIRDQVEQWPANTKWLIGLALVTLVALLLLVLQYAGNSTYATITDFASDRHGEVLQRLRGVGINVKTSDGQLRVPADQHYRALAVLARSDLIASDTSSAIDELIRSRSVWESNDQFNKKLRLVRQQWLGRIIAKFDGVRFADVVIDIPDTIGFGKTHVRPSAAVQVVMEGRKQVDQKLVEAFAGLVSSAVAEMTPQDVVVIDAGAGRQFTMKDAEDFGPEDTLRVLQQREQYYQQKIASMLRYITGVIVAVNVQVEPIGKKDVKGWKYEKEQPLDSTEAIFRENHAQGVAGEAGPRPNVGANIAGSFATGSFNREEINREKFRNKPILEESQVRYVGQSTKQINVSVNVPRSYLVALPASRISGFTEGASDGNHTAALDGAAVQVELDRIASTITPLIVADKPGDLRVEMFDDRPSTEKLTYLGDPTGFAAVVKAGWVRPVGLTMLVLMVVGLIFTMVHKAIHQPPLASAGELAGGAQVLESQDELVGEVEESGGSPAGIDKGMGSRRVAERISELVKANPQETAHLVNQWVRSKD